MKQADDHQALLKRAERLLKSSMPNDRHAGEQQLVELSSSSLSDVAVRARELLSELPVHGSPARKDPAFEEFESEWTWLRSPLYPGALDSRYRPWLEWAEKNPDLLQRFSPRLQDIVEGWVGEYERLLEMRDGFDDPRVAHFDEWAQTVSRYPAVCEILRGPLKRARALRSERILSVRSTEIAKALDRGKVSEAWQLLEDVEALRDIPPQKITRVTDDTYAVSILRDAFERWRRELPPAPQNLYDLVRMGQAWMRGRDLAQERRMPSVWTAEISAELARLEAALRAFSEVRAASCGSFEDFQQLVMELRDRARGADPEFANALLAPLAGPVNAFIAIQVEAAADPTALRGLHMSAAELLTSVPQSNWESVRDELRWMERIRAAWQSSDFAQFQEDGSVENGARRALPSRFREELRKAERSSQELESVRAALERPGNTAERLDVHRHAMSALEKILDEAPGHVAARELQTAMSSRIQHLLLDQWIEAWDMEKLKAAAEGAQSWDMPYAQLLRSVDALDQLAEHRKMPVDRTNLLEMVKSWELWKEAEAQLPAVKPESSERALKSARQEIVTAIRASFADYITRSTTVDQDKIIESALAPFAPDLGLGNEYVTFLSHRQTSEVVELIEKRRWAEAEEKLSTLGRDADAWPRLRTLLDVRRAQDAGAGELAAVLREKWGHIERYLPDSSRILRETIERAWDVEDDDALSSLREVALRVLARGSDDELARWVEWLGIEQSLSGAAAPEAVARLQPFLQFTNRAVGRRLERLISKWRRKRDTVALAWAYRALAQTDLMPGADPLSDLLQETEAQVAAFMDACKSAAHVDAAFVEVNGRGLRRITDSWSRLDKLLLAARGAAGDWPEPPPSLVEANKLLMSIEEVLTSLASLQKSDLRLSGPQWDRLNNLVRFKLGHFPFASEISQVLKRSEHLTRLKYLESEFRKACERCGSVADRDLDEPGLFPVAAARLTDILDRFDRARPEGSCTWQIMSAEYWRDVPVLAGDLTETTGVVDPDLRSLIQRFDALEENETLFRKAIATLWDRHPAVGSLGEFDPEAHEEYLRLYPSERPRSRRVWMLFQRFAEKSPQPVVLHRSRHLLPDWIGPYLDARLRGGAPW